MAVNFESHQPYDDAGENLSSRNGGTRNYRSSLSALENAWGHVASTKENLESVGRRIAKAKTSLNDENEASGKNHNGKMQRKYGRKGRGKVHLNLNPEIRYKEQDDDIILQKEDLRSRRFPLYGEWKSSHLPEETHELDFQYEIDEEPFSERPRSPVVPRLNSSLTGRSLGASLRETGALARLRHKIQQQKDSLSSPEQRAPFSNKVNHAEDDPVIPNETFRELMRRKVASVSSAPAYKGFNLPETKENIAHTSRLAGLQSQKLLAHQERKERVGNAKQQVTAGPKKVSKKNVKKSPGKMQRIVAERKPIPSITTTSWRVGQEAAKKALGAMKTAKDRTINVERIESADVSDTDEASPSEVTKKSNKDSATISDSQTDSTSSQTVRDSSRTAETNEGKSKADIGSRSSTPNRDDTEMHDEEDEEEDLKNISKDLSMHEDLPEEAKSVLAELQMDSSDESETLKINIKGTRPAPNKAKKSPEIKKSVKRKASAVTKMKNDEEKYRKNKIRHYDQQAIQDYMAQQLAERKKKRLQDKRRQQKLKLEHEKQLFELYQKQKTSLKSSLAPKRKNLLGSTFTTQDKSGKASTNQAKLQADTAMKNLALEHMIGSHPSLAGSPENSYNAATSRASSTYDISSPMKPRIEENLNETSEIDGEFRDSLELDHSGSHLLGIRSVTVKKSDNEAATEKATSLQPVRSVEEEVRELLERYKAKTLSKPETADQVPDNTDPAKRSKAERIAAISATANSLRERLAAEANRLANLRIMASKEKPLSFPTDMYTGFRGALPGIGNIDEQAGLNKELQEKDEAATKIQAVFRGHSLRQGLNWKLPSGNSFGTFRQAASEQSKQPVLKASVDVSSRASSQSSYTSAFEGGSDVSLYSEEAGSTASLIDASRPAVNTLEASGAHDFTRPKFKSLQSERQTKPSGAQKADDYLMKDILNRGGGGDRYSVINILARRLKEANKKVVLPKDEGLRLSSTALAMKNSGHERLSNSQDDLYEQDFEEAEYDTSSSTIKTDVLEEERASILSEKRNDESIRSLVQRSRSSGHTSKSAKDDHESFEAEDPDKTLTLLQEDLQEDGTSVWVKSYVSGQRDSTTTLSPPNSPSSLTEGSVDLEKQPIMTSTLRHPHARSEMVAHTQSDHSLAASFNEVTNKFSPGTLERKLRAEVNQLETMDDALRQVTDIERVRAVSLAQQETVSLAQILKARQLGHQQELEKMSQLARDEAIGKARDLQKIQEAATKSAESATKTIAEVRKEATDAITQSKRRCEEVQDDANARAERAAMEVEKAQKMASDVILESANRYSTNIEKLATSTASAAASSAVQTALQIHKEQLEQLRNEAMNKVSRSYSKSTFSSGSTRSSSGETTLTKSLSPGESPSHVKSYADEEFEELSPEKSSVADISRTASKKSNSSIRETSSFIGQAYDQSKSFSQNDSSIRESNESISESINEEFQGKKSTESLKTKDDANTLLTSKKSYQNALEETIQPSSDVDEKSFKFEDHLASSLTEDEIDDGFRMVLPVVSHRRKSLERDRRSRHKNISYNGTSSDEMKITPRAQAKHGSQSPFVGEDTFSQFTSGMVKQYLQEEEIRSKHQTALLKLREKALIEKTKAEMAWLELQKSKLKNKGSDDLMPPINKKQRGLIMKLQSEQGEIRRLKQAYRAASHERKFMLYQQNEISRLKKNTQKIWDKLGQEKSTKNGVQGQELIENKSISEASSIASVDHSSLISEDLNNTGSHTSKIMSLRDSRVASATPTQTRSLPKDALPSESIEEIHEEVPSELISAAKDQSTFPTYNQSSTSSKGLSESRSKDLEPDRGQTRTPTEDVTLSEHTQSSVVADLKKLRKKASEDYLLKREKTLKERQNQFQSVLQKQNEMSDWQNRIEKEEMRLKSEIKKALDRTRTRITSPTLFSSKRSTEDSSESTIRDSENTALRTPTKSAASKEKSSESDTSVTEDLKTASLETDSELPESIASVSASMRKGSDNSFPEEYADDTFESPTATQSQTKKLSPKSESRATSSIRSVPSRKIVKESDESRSEEETSIADATSDASDIEKRIRQLEDELIRKRKDLERVRKKKEKDQLRRKEQRLKQELQAVESLISIEDKENINDRSVSDANAFIKGSVSPKILSPKILQQSSLHDQNASKKLKDNSSKARTDNRNAEETNERSSQEKDSLSQKKFAKSVADKVMEEAKQKVEKEIGGIHHSQIKSISEELDAIKKIRDISDEERTSVTSYSDNDFEIEHSKSFVKEESRKLSDRSGKDSNSSISESISSVLEEKAADSDSIESEIHSEHDSNAIQSEHSAIFSTKNYSQHSTSSSTTPRSIATKSATDHTRTPRSNEISLQQSQSVKENLKLNLGDRSSDSIHSVLEAIASEQSITERIRDNSRSNEKEASSFHEQKQEDDIYQDDFFESSSSTRSERSSRASKLDEKLEAVSERSRKERASLSEDASLRSASVKSESQLSKTSQSSSKFSTDAMGESASALSKFDAFRINDKVVVDGALNGTIRFIGKTSFSPVIVAGIELDLKLGNTDGSFRGKRYFTCPSDYGHFTPVKNIILSRESVRKTPDSNRPLDNSVEEVEDIISEDLEASMKSDLDRDESRNSSILSPNKKLDSLSILRSASDRAASEKEKAYRGLRDREERLASREESYRRSSHDDDHKNDKAVTDQEISYLDDFEDDITSKQQKSSTQKESRASISEDIVSEHISAGSDVSKNEEKSSKMEIRPDLTDFSLPGLEVLERRGSLTESVGSSEAGIPLPPRLDLDQLADSLTESLLKKLLVESFQVAVPSVGQEEASTNKSRQLNSDGTLSSKLEDRSLPKGVSKATAKINLREEHSLTDGEISEDILESLSERSDDTIKRMTVQAGANNLRSGSFEVNESYVTPSLSDSSIASNKQQAAGTLSEMKGELRGVMKIQEHKEPDTRTIVPERSQDEVARISEKEVDKVTKILLSDAVSHMTDVMREKQSKLLAETQNQILTEDWTPNASKKQEAAHHASPLQVNVIVKNKDGLVISPPDVATPPEPLPGDIPMAFDTDLLAAKLSELKKMDQEMDDLLGEDSDEDEPFALTGDGDILQLPDDETDLIPPVRDFDFGEPIIYVPHTVPEISRYVSESASIIISKLVHVEEYESLSPADSYLKPDPDTCSSDFEKSSNILYKKMIFDVTKDLFQEAKEFKSIQHVTKQPWVKPSRRVFAKFIRQIHHLTGQDLIKSLQKHVCVCLGLEQGRPSLDVLKRRLPLNTAKKDYIDALLVEELREEEPQWVNYDEDELRVKDQLTQGILENLIDETVQLISDIQNRRNRLEDLV